MQTEHKPKFREAPKYWWDFSFDTKAVEVCSNQLDGPVAVFFYTDMADPAIERAKKLINDLNAGRISAPKRTE